jgi:hypothetical protein
MFPPRKSNALSTENCSQPKSRHRPPFEALLAAAQLYDITADHIVVQGCGPVGLAAGKIIDSARFCLNLWISTHRAT